MAKRRGSETSSAGEGSPRRLAAPQLEAFEAFSSVVFRQGDLSERTKQLIAVAVAHVTQCQRCIDVHTRAALRTGATPQEIMEAIWVAAEMRAGAAIAHSKFAIDALSGGDAAR